MSILFTGVFWGAFLVLLGLSVLLKAYFHIDIPVFRTFFGLFFILLGVQILLGRGLLRRDDHSEQAFFSEASWNEPAWGGRYDLAFGKGVLDLGRLGAVKDGDALRVNTVFGQTELRVDPKQAVEVQVDAAFSGAKFPDGTVISFGKHAWRSAAWKADKPFARVRASVVFGALEVKE